jgi:uncharacterized protein with ParB-like and HNH nuclease domain
MQFFIFCNSLIINNLSIVFLVDIFSFFNFFYPKRPFFMSEYPIISIKELFEIENLKLPDYQRPYKWETKNCLQLIDDIIGHFYKEPKVAYRLGTLVLHQDEDNLNIVDGQQRTISLCLIAHILGLDIKKLAENLKFENEISQLNIRNNYQHIQEHHQFKTLRQNEDFKKFFLEKCELVQIKLTDIDEAFQFFDSQNARGKTLDPHDLLKAYHLRAMSHNTENERIAVVEKWENVKTNDLVDIFNHLFFVKLWSCGLSSKQKFDKEQIHFFKGIDENTNFPFAKIYQAADCFVNAYNQHSHTDFDQKKLTFPFQINTTILNGKRFFEMTSFYKDLLEKIKKGRENIKFDRNNGRVSRASRDKLEMLCFCAFLAYVDKFGFDDKFASFEEKITEWAISLRESRKFLQWSFIDNEVYANNIFLALAHAYVPETVLNFKINHHPPKTPPSLK